MVEAKNGAGGAGKVWTTGKPYPTAGDIDLLRLECIPIDKAFWDSEQKWGVGRLERMQSADVLAAYRRGWTAYTEALEAWDWRAVREIGPKMIQALAFMDAQAVSAGEKPLAPETWETRMADGTVLVVCRSEAEQGAVLRASRASETGGADVDDALPVDLTATVRHQHEGRKLECWTLAQICRLIERHGSVVDRGRIGWEGEPVEKTQQMGEGAAADIARMGWPMSAPLAVDLGF